MRRFVNILLFSIVSLITTISCIKEDSFGVEKDDNTNTSTGSVVEVLADGRIKVTASISATEQTPIETRAAGNVSPDNVVYTGWCLIFGVDKTLYDVTTAQDGTQIVTDKATNKVVKDGYGPNSPLLQKTRIVANTNGRFYMTFDQTEDRVFMRIVANLSNKEDESYDEAIAQVDIAENDAVTKPATFGQFIEQSIGLDGIYDFNYEGETTTDYDPTTGLGSGKITYTKENTVSPDPANTQRAFPMTSYGYVLDRGISAESVEEIFNTEIKMIRIFSKIVVYAKEGSNFTIDNVTLLKGANESRVRSTVLSSSSDVVDHMYDVPADLGGAVPYNSVGTVSGSESMPIYLYPNWGGAYANGDGSVNENVNRTYLIIRGKAAGYQDYGYYKVALKARYPETYDADGNPVTYSALTYDIIRDNFFHINLEKIDKPGYATFEDAANEKNPANNISYSIVINGDDNRNEYLVSKGTYYVELKTSRIYAKGYGTTGISGEHAYVEFTMSPTEGNIVPAVYIQSSDYEKNISTDNVAIEYCKVLRKGDAGYESGLDGDGDWTNATRVNPTINNTGDGYANKDMVYITPDEKATKVRVYFKATKSGRIRLRIGDMLKYIPILYQARPIYIKGEPVLTITDDTHSTWKWNNFAYTEYNYIEKLKEVGPRILNTDGSTTNNSGVYINKELIARVLTSDNSGIAQVYLRQASDFGLYTEYDNSGKAATGGDKGSNNIFSVTKDSDLKSTYNAAINYQSTGKVHKLNTKLNGFYDGNRIMNKWWIGTAPITFTAKGEFTTSGASSTKDSNNSMYINKGFINYNWAGLTHNSTVTLSAINIKGNQPEGSTYDSKYAKIENSATVTLSNIAGETKVYKLELEQSAAPYMDDIDLVDGVYLWDCPVVGDCRDTKVFGNNSNIGNNVARTPKIYNAHYSPGGTEWDPNNLSSNYWSWTEVPAKDPVHTDYTGGSKGKDAVIAGMNVTANPNNNTSTEYVFEVNVLDHNKRGKWKAFFDMRLINDAGELIVLRLRLRRDDNSQ